MVDELKAWSEEKAYDRAKAEFIEKLDNIRDEIDEIYMSITFQENKNRKATWGLRKAMEIIDKYKESENNNDHNKV